TVLARSEGPGRGSEFTIRLPLLGAGAGETADRPGIRKRASGRRLRVLVVDDNQDAAETMALLIRLWGHDVWTAHQGAAALDIVARERPQVVLLDIGLPGIDGYEVARRVRADPNTGETVLVALTGYGQTEDRARSREAGFTVHLVKPVEPEVIQRLLDKVQPAPVA